MRLKTLRPSRAQHHLEINFQGVLHVENKIGLDHRFKSQLLHLDAIASRRQVGDVIASYLVRDGFVVDSRAGVDHDDFRTWDNRLAGVGDPPGKRCIRRLRVEKNRGQQKERCEAKRRARNGR